MILASSDAYIDARTSISKCVIVSRSPANRDVIHIIGAYSHVNLNRMRIRNDTMRRATDRSRPLPALKSNALPTEAGGRATHTEYRRDNRSGSASNSQAALHRC